MKKFILLAVVFVCALQITAFASQPIPPWERLNYNYQFRSGMDYRVDLGRPTTFDGIVPVDVFTANIRTDSNVALRPPSYGISSGVIPTEPINRLFPQPLPHNWGGNFGLVQLPMNVIPSFDTLQQGVNAPPVGNPLHFQNVGTGTFLPPTSIR